SSVVTVLPASTTASSGAMPPSTAAAALASPGEIGEPAGRAVGAVERVGVDVDASVDQVVGPADHVEQRGGIGHRDIAFEDGDVRTGEPVRRAHPDPDVGRVVEGGVQLLVQAA